MVSMFMRSQYKFYSGEFKRKPTDNQLKKLFVKWSRYDPDGIMPCYMTEADYIREWREIEAERDPLNGVYNPGDDWDEEFAGWWEGFHDGCGNRDYDNRVFTSYKGTNDNGNRWLLFVWDNGEMVLNIEQGQLVTYDRDLVERAIKAA